MIFPGFIGPSYTSQSIIADSQLLKNMFPEKVESGVGKDNLVLYSRPGLSVFCTLTDTPLRAIFYQDGRCFAVAGAHFYEIFSDGTFASRGVVQNTLTNTLATISSNGQGGHQLYITAGGVGYIYDLNANTLNTVVSTSPTFPTPMVQGLFSDGFFISLQQGTGTLWISSANNGTVWSGGNAGQRSSSSDTLQSIWVNHRELWLFGSLTTEVWYDAGLTTGFPYQPIPGAFLEQGAFMWSIGSIDNTLFWIGQDRVGQGIAYRADGYSPKRISNHAIEFAWAGYSTISDVEAFCYQEAGHAFYVVNFPTAQKTWVYDVATDMWHERDWYNVATAQFEAGLARVHAEAFGVHLVGDRQSGNVYTQSIFLYNDNGIAMHRRRRAPHISNELMWMRHNDFLLDAEMGLGTTTLGQDPQATLRWSNDGGKTWSFDYQTSLGKTGNYFLRARWSRLGRARDRVYEVECTENMPVRFINAYLDVQPGNGG